MAITFDGPNRLISFDALPTELSVIDLYSRWKDWVLTGNNSGYLEAFTPVGGQDIDLTQGTRVPLYAFLVNDWRIRPYEANHTLNVTQGVLLVSGGGDPFIETLTPYTVRINYQQPVQAIGVPATADHWQEIIENSLTARQIMRLLLAATVNKSIITDLGGGTFEQRFRDAADAIDRIVGTVDSTGQRTGVTIDGGSA